MLRELAGKYPYITEMATAAAHDDESVVGSGCDDQFEFEFALDLLLDGSNGSSGKGGAPPTKPDGATGPDGRSRSSGHPSA